MIVLGTAFFKPSCSTASTKRLCSLAVQTRRGRLRARACSRSASSGPANALGGDGKYKATKRTDSHFQDKKHSLSLSHSAVQAQEKVQTGEPDLMQSTALESKWHATSFLRRLKEGAK